MHLLQMTTPSLGEKKSKKIWEVYFVTHQQSKDFNGCLKILPIAASLAICQFVLLQVYVSVFPVLCSSYFFKKKQHFAYADDVLLFLFHQAIKTGSNFHLNLTFSFLFPHI